MKREISIKYKVVHFVSALFMMKDGDTFLIVMSMLLVYIV